MTHPAPRRSRVIMAYAVVYIVWGSTYLAIRYAVTTIPPLLMAGTRFMVAGTLLYAWVRIRGGTARPAARQWRVEAIAGALLLLGGNGGVVWAEQRLPSGITALLVASEPLWLVLLDWMGHREHRPSRSIFAGLFVGFVGMVVLVAPSLGTGTGSIHLVSAVIVVLAALSWAGGSLVAVRSPGGTSSPFLAPAMQMLTGGALLIAAGLVTGEWSHLALGAVSSSSAAGLLYLIVFGSLLGYSAYTWLLSVEPPARVATYGFVNPVVAVLLGWAIAGEVVTIWTIAAAVLVVGAVALITTGQHRSSH